MRTYLTLFFLLLPTTLFAQNYGSMNNKDMQGMMQVMQGVQKCMANIDQTKLNELQARSEKINQEINALCTQGKRDKAQKRAMAFGKKIASDPTMQQMRKCGEMAQGALPMEGMVETYDEKEYANRHVCDG
jgi:cell division protein FtsB